MFHYEGGGINDFVLKEPLLTGGLSNRPLHDLAVAQEHVRLGTALYALKRLRCPVYELKTGSILFRPLKRAKLGLRDITYENLHAQRDVYEGTGSRRLNELCALPQSLGHGAVFRVQTATQDDWLRCDPKRPRGRHGTTCQ